MPVASITVLQPRPSVTILTISPTSSGFETQSMPTFLASSRREGAGSTPMTVAPDSRASCAAMFPTSPRPETSTVSPSWMSDTRMAVNAMVAMRTMGMLWMSSPSGTRAIRL